MDVSTYYGEDPKTPAADTKETKRFDNMNDIPSFMITDTDPNADRGPEDVDERGQNQAQNPYLAGLKNSSGRKFSLQLGKLFHRRKSSTPNIPEVRRHSNVERSLSKRGEDLDVDLGGSGKRRGSTFEYMSEATGL